MAQRMRHSLQACFQGFCAERSPQTLVDSDPVTGRVQRLLGQMDRSRADVLVRVKPDLFEHRREAGDFHFPMAARDALVVWSAERIEYAHAPGRKRVRVVVDSYGP